MTIQVPPHSVLVACEWSATVRDAFMRRGIQAMSCDVKESKSPGAHYKGDVLDLLEGDWSLVIGFPPCTDLAWVNGALIHQKRRDGRTQRALDFALKLYESGARAAIENPRGDLYYWRQPDQVVHPWMFGDPYLKTTALWLRGLPRLQPDVHQEPAGAVPWVRATPGQRQGIARGPRKRGRTFEGIAEAMAEQWGPLVSQPVTTNYEEARSA